MDMSAYCHFQNLSVVNVKVQMYKCTNVQMYKYTNVQMYKCTNVQMYKCLKTKLFHHQELDPQGWGHIIYCPGKIKVGLRETFHTQTFFCQYLDFQLAVAF